MGVRKTGSGQDSRPETEISPIIPAGQKTTFEKKSVSKGFSRRQALLSSKGWNTKRFVTLLEKKHVTSPDQESKPANYRQAQNVRDPRRF